MHAASMLEVLVFLYCIDALGFFFFSKHVICHMPKFAGHRPAMKQMHSVGVCGAGQHISVIWLRLVGSA